MSLTPRERLEKQDPAVLEALDQEERRQYDKLEMIASENYVSPAVLYAQGSVLTNKYAEGYPGKRYYGGCEHVDVTEQLAIDRAKELFGAEHANVQPHAGAQANMAVFFALLEPGDRVLGLDLSHGGHLTHGMKKNFSGSIYESHFYQVEPGSETIDYEALENVAQEVQPKMIIAGASAYSRFLDWEAFRRIADQVGAYFMVDMAHIAGLVATGLHPSPVPFADVVTTTTHKTLRGPRGGLILCKDKFRRKINSAVFPGLQGGPLEHVIAAKAVALGEALKPEFKVYQQQVLDNCRALSESLQGQGFRIVSGGSDNHLILVDCSVIGLTGHAMQEALDHVGITCNKNTIPFETLKPTVTSGIRLGTPALTTRGLKEADLTHIGTLIGRVAKLVRKNLPEDRDASLEEVQALTPEQMEQGHEAEWDAIRTEVASLVKDRPLFAW